MAPPGKIHTADVQIQDLIQQVERARTDSEQLSKEEQDRVHQYQEQCSALELQVTGLRDEVQDGKSALEKMMGLLAAAEKRIADLLQELSDERDLHEERCKALSLSLGDEKEKRLEEETQRNTLSQKLLAVQEELASALGMLHSGKDLHLGESFSVFLCISLSERRGAMFCVVWHPMWFHGSM